MRLLYLLLEMLLFKLWEENGFNGGPSPIWLSIFLTYSSNRRVKGEWAFKAASFASLFLLSSTFSSYMALILAMHSVALLRTLSSWETLLVSSFIIVSFSLSALWFFKWHSTWCSFSWIQSRRSLLSSLTWCSFFPHLTPIVSSSIWGASVGVLGTWFSSYFVRGVWRLLLSWCFCYFAPLLWTILQLGEGFRTLEASTTLSSSIFCLFNLAPSFFGALCLCILFDVFTFIFLLIIFNFHTLYILFWVNY